MGVCVCVGGVTTSNHNQKITSQHPPTPGSSTFVMLPLTRYAGRNAQLRFLDVDYHDFASAIGHFLTRTGKETEKVRTSGQ